MAVKTTIHFDTSAATPSELQGIFALMAQFSTHAAVGANDTATITVPQGPEKAPLQEPTPAPTPAPTTPGKREAAPPVATAQVEVATPVPGPTTAAPIVVPDSTASAPSPAAAPVAAPSPASTAATDTGFENLDAGKDDPGYLADDDLFKAACLPSIKTAGNRAVRKVLVDEFQVDALRKVAEADRHRFLKLLEALPAQSTSAA